MMYACWFSDRRFVAAVPIQPGREEERQKAAKECVDIINAIGNHPPLMVLWFDADEMEGVGGVNLMGIDPSEQSAAAAKVAVLEVSRLDGLKKRREEERRKSNARFVRTDDSLKKARSEGAANDLLLRLRLQFDFECENDGVDEEAWEQDWLDSVRRNPYEGRRHCAALGEKAGGWFIWEDETAECAGGVLFVTDEEYEKLEGRA